MRSDTVMHVEFAIHWLFANNSYNLLFARDFIIFSNIVLDYILGLPDSYPLRLQLVLWVQYQVTMLVIIDLWESLTFGNCIRKISIFDGCCYCVNMFWPLNNVILQCIVKLPSVKGVTQVITLSLFHIYGGFLRTWCELFLFRENLGEIISRFREIISRFREIIPRFFAK